MYFDLYYAQTPAQQEFHACGFMILLCFEGCTFKNP